MPFLYGSSTRGAYVQYSKYGKKYFYQFGDHKSFMRAWKKAQKQAKAIIASKNRRR